MPQGDKLKQPAAVKNAVFDDLGAAAAVICRRQRFECVRVAENGDRLIKAACLIFTRVEIDGGLAANRGINRRKQRCGYLNE